MHNNSSSIAILMTISAVTIASAPASGTTYIYDGGGSGAWTDPLAWNLNSGYPDDASDAAIIGAYSVPLRNATLTVGYVLLTDDESCLHLNDAHLKIVGSGTSLTMAVKASLKVEKGGKLEVDGVSCAPIIAGTIVLTHETSILLFSSSATLTTDVVGYGSIKGLHNSARFEIAAGKLVANTITIEGAMTIDVKAGSAGQVATLNNVGDSTQYQQAVILANGSGAEADTLTLGPDLKLLDFADGFGPLYQVDGEHARLLFLRPCDGSEFDKPVLDGRFVITNCGTLDVREDVFTVDSLTQTKGRVVTDGPASPCFYFNIGTICDSRIIGSCTW